MSKLYFKRKKEQRDPGLFLYHLCNNKFTIASKAFKYWARSLLPIPVVKHIHWPNLISAPQSNQVEQTGSAWIHRTHSDTWSLSHTEKAVRTPVSMGVNYDLQELAATHHCRCPAKGSAPCQGKSAGPFSRGQDHRRQHATQLEHSLLPGARRSPPHFLFPSATRGCLL